MTSAQSPSKANNLKDNEEPYPSLTVLQRPKKAKKSSGEDTKVRCPMCRDPTHKFWENILPRNQDGHRNTLPPSSQRRWEGLYPVRQSARIWTPGNNPNGSCRRACPRRRRKAESPPLSEDWRSADQPKPPSGDPGGGDVTDTPPRNSGGTASTRLPGPTHHLLPSHPYPHHTPPRPDSFGGKQRPLRKMSS